MNQEDPLLPLVTTSHLLATYPSPLDVLSTANAIFHSVRPTLAVDENPSNACLLSNLVALWQPYNWNQNPPPGTESDTSMQNALK